MSIFPNTLVLNDNFHSRKFNLEFLFYISKLSHFFESICSLFSISTSYYIPRRKEIFHLLQFQQLLPLKNQIICFSLKHYSWERSQDGGGVGRGDHFLPHKFIKRAFKRRVNSTKQLLNAGRGHQAPRKAAQLFERR